ncbi:MAG: signal peptidase I [Oscillospiraceae bacterium]|nr:signal peptidase I [Oscillospiraceae bacterium]
MKDKKKIIKDILRIFLLIVCGTAIGVNAYMLNAKNLVGNNLPMPFGYGAAVVLSGSMEPEFSKGDLIVVKETEDFSLNDIVVFESGNSLVVHRVVGMGGEEIVTKGDANNVADDPIKSSDVLGRVLFHIPFVGNVVNFIKTPVGTILLVAAAILLVEIPHMKEVRKDDEEMQAIIDEIKRLKDEV